MGLKSEKHSQAHGGSPAPAYRGEVSFGHKLPVPLPLVDPESTEQRTMHQNLGSCDPKQTLSEAVWSQLLRSDVKPLLWVLTAALDPLVNIWMGLK